MPSQKNARPMYKLNEAEMNNPMIVIDELFDFADLADAKELLWTWLKTTVTGTYHRDLSSTERSAIITLYEKIEKLFEASHVIKRARKKGKRFSRKGAGGQS